MFAKASRLPREHCTNLRTMRVPNALPIVLSLSFSFALLQIFLRGLSFEFLKLRPPIFEYLYGNIESVDLGGADISGVVRRG